MLRSGSPIGRAAKGTSVSRSAGEDGVGLGAGEDGDCLQPRGDEGAGDVDSLAAGFLADGDGPLDFPAEEGAGQRHGAVQAGVGGEGDNHATTTSTPASARASASSRLGCDVCDHGVQIFQRGELDQRFRVQLGGISQHHNAAR